MKETMKTVLPLKFRQCKRNLNKPKLPGMKLPRLKLNTNLIIHGLFVGAITAGTNRNSLLTQKTSQRKKPIGAGRGGKQLVSRSHYADFY
jgi:hypothetical protein